MFGLMPYERRERGMMDLFNDLDRYFFGGNQMPQTAMQCKTDIQDKGDSYLLSAELPGFKKEDIHIDVDGNMLTISAEHNEESEDKKKGYIRKERRYGSFKRSFDLTGVDSANIGADYTDGILTLDLPKLVKQPDSTRRIELK